jgi:hypothetical protein
MPSLDSLTLFLLPGAELEVNPVIPSPFNFMLLLCSCQLGTMQSRDAFPFFCDF